MRRYNDPQEIIECGPENYGKHECKFCASEEYCRNEYEEAKKRGDIRDEA